MKIIIAGYGFVGKAVADSLKDTHELYIVDPKYNRNSISQYSHADCMIVCVGTPSAKDGNCDISQVESVLYDAPYGMPILIKCTVPPDYLEKLIIDYPNTEISYSPEFLRAASATDDFKNQTYMIIGGDNFIFWKEIFEVALHHCQAYLNTTIAEASMIKYATNTFLSVKVTFFNQLYDMCLAGNVDYDVVKQLLSYDHRIGASHMQVPGPDGHRGYGGGCFPKDTNAFVHYSDRLNTKVSVLESAIKYNKKIRKTLT